VPDLAAVGALALRCAGVGLALWLVRGGRRAAVGGGGKGGSGGGGSVGGRGSRAREALGFVARKAALAVALEARKFFFESFVRRGFSLVLLPLGDE